MLDAASAKNIYAGVALSPESDQELHTRDVPGAVHKGPPTWH